MSQFLKKLSNLSRPSDDWRPEEHMYPQLYRFFIKRIQEATKTVAENRKHFTHYSPRPELYDINWYFDEAVEKLQETSRKSSKFL